MTQFTITVLKIKKNHAYQKKDASYERSDKGPKKEGCSFFFRIFRLFRTFGLPVRAT